MVLLFSILAAVVLVINFIVSTEMQNTIVKKVIIYITIILSVLFVGMTSSSAWIDPLEVYRGNTKLEITEKIVNGKVIERDSTVVLK